VKGVASESWREMTEQCWIGRKWGFLMKHHLAWIPLATIGNVDVALGKLDDDLGSRHCCCFKYLI